MSKLKLVIPEQEYLIASGGPLDNTIKRTGTSLATISNEFDYSISAILKTLKYDLVLEADEPFVPRHLDDEDEDD